MMNSGTSAEFPGEKDPKIKKAAERERTERVQVYERLHQNEDNGGVLDMYKAFGIASDEKAKKARLAGGICKSCFAFQEAFELPLMIKCCFFIRDWRRAKCESIIRSHEASLSGA
jgi:hypothetical protein